MRPVQLHLEGFGVFRAPVDVSFDDVDYFALVGPTGAGKSTIIDAICFALYGSVPRYGDERLVGRVVSVGGQQAKVSLTFDVAGARYRATRVVRLGKGKADALLERELDSGTEVVASGAREMKLAVERLLGLPFGHFTKCVVLPQGEFAKFLHDEPAKRRDLLARLLDLGVYDRIGQRAREAARDAAKAAEMLQHQLDELAFATEATREQASARVEQLLVVQRMIEDARAHDDRDAELMAAAGERARAAGELAALLDTISVADGVDEVGAEHAAAVASHAQANAAASMAADALANAEARRETLGDPAELVHVREAHAAARDVEAELEAATRDVRTHTTEVERAAALATRARAHEAETHATLDTARNAHAAQAVAAHLVAGEPCPVCEQVVVSVPERTPPAALADAERALAEAQKMVAGADRAHVELSNALAAATGRHEQLAAQRATLQPVIAAHPDVDAVEGALAAIKAADAELKQARDTEKKARAAVKAATARLEAIDEQTRAIRAAYAAQRDALLRAGAEPPAGGDDLTHAWHELVAWAEAEAASRRVAVVDAQTEHDRLAHARAERVAGLAFAANEAQVASTATTLAGLRDEVLEQSSNARHELARIEETIEQAAKLREQLDATRSDHQVARTLGELLKSDRFEKWVLAEALHVLVESASRTLYTLTQGHYSMRYSNDEEFVVVDHHNADETRSVRTLSGGETFQASLALALALSDQIAELSAAGGTKLDAIFCDEGFGSLDADTLDAVASTIESLGASGRMIGLVTHVPALAERVPVRFRVHDGVVTREET